MARFSSSSSDPRVGTSTDTGEDATLFGRHKKLVTAVHSHMLLVVHDASSLDANLDTPLKELLEEFGYTVDVDVSGEGINWTTEEEVKE